MRKYAFLVWKDDPERTAGTRTVIEAVNSFAAVVSLLVGNDITKYREVDLIRDPENWKSITRASGQAPCDFCGQPLDNHQQPTRDTAPTVVIDCAGNWLKT